MHYQIVPTEDKMTHINQDGNTSDSWEKLLQFLKNAPEPQMANKGVKLFPLKGANFTADLPAQIETENLPWRSKGLLRFNNGTTRTWELGCLALAPEIILANEASLQERLSDLRKTLPGILEANEKGAAPFTDEEVISFRKTLEGEGFDPVKTAQQLAARSPIRIEGKNILSTAWGKRTVSYEIGIKPGLDQLQEGGVALEADNIREAVLRIGEKYCAIYDVLDRGPLEETLCVVAAGGSLQLAALTELLEEGVDPALYLIDQRSGQGAQIRVWSDYNVVHEKASQGVYGLSREEMEKVCEAIGKVEGYKRPRLTYSQRGDNRCDVSKAIIPQGWPFMVWGWDTTNFGGHISIGTFYRMAWLCLHHHLPKDITELLGKAANASNLGIKSLGVWVQEQKQPQETVIKPAQVAALLMANARLSRALDDQIESEYIEEKAQKNNVQTYNLNSAISSARKELHELTQELCYALHKQFGGSMNLLQGYSKALAKPKMEVLQIDLDEGKADQALRCSKVIWDVYGQLRRTFCLNSSGPYLATVATGSQRAAKGFTRESIPKGRATLHHNAPMSLAALHQALYETMLGIPPISLRFCDAADLGRKLEKAAETFATRIGSHATVEEEEFEPKLTPQLRVIIESILNLPNAHLVPGLDGRIWPLKYLGGGQMLKEKMEALLQTRHREFPKDAAAMLERTLECWKNMQGGTVGKEVDEVLLWANNIDHYNSKRERKTLQRPLPWEPRRVEELLARIRRAQEMPFYLPRMIQASALLEEKGKAATDAEKTALLQGAGLASDERDLAILKLWNRAGAEGAKTIPAIPRGLPAKI
jgi:hypothetical protein